MWVLSFAGVYSRTLFFTLDKVRVLLSLLTCWITIYIFVFIRSIRNWRFVWRVFLLFFFLVLSFWSVDFFGFYVFFEVSLIPIIIIILGWGYQIERIRASFYLFIYTIFGSLPLLLSFVYVYQRNSSVLWVISKSENFYFFFLSFFIILSFLIKLPVYLFHVWLPKAHVEAPTVGSIILAAVLLKLGVYGVYRRMPLMLGFIFDRVNFWTSLLLFGAVMSAWICFVQRDLKSLVAYSSISHIGLLIATLVSQRNLAIFGMLVVSISHGFCSSALFFLVGRNYEQIATRQLLLIRGQGSLQYIFSLMWVILLLVNFGVPPFMTVIGELVTFVVILRINFFFFFLLGFTILFVSYFCLYVYRVLVHGRQRFYQVVDQNCDYHYLVVCFHFFPCVFFVLNFSLFFYLNSLY